MYVPKVIFKHTDVLGGLLAVGITRYQSDNLEVMEHFRTVYTCRAIFEDMIHLVNQLNTNTKHSFCYYNSNIQLFTLKFSLADSTQVFS